MAQDSVPARARVPVQGPARAPAQVQVRAPELEPVPG
jgi:hypothetical protein